MLGKKLRDILEIREINQAELARRAGVSTSLVSEILKGKRKNVSTDTIEKFSTALNISPEYFFQSGVIGPKEMFKHMTVEEKIFFSDPTNTPWIKLTKAAAAEGLTPVEIRAAIEFIKQFKNK